MKFRQFVLRKDDAGADAGGGTVDRGDTLPEPKAPDTAAADAAAEALTAMVERGALPGILIERVDGLSALRSTGPAVDPTVNDGFTRTPRGLRLCR